MYALFLLCMRYSFLHLLAVCLIPTALYASIIHHCMRCGVCVKGGTHWKIVFSVIFLTIYLTYQQIYACKQNNTWQITKNLYNCGFYPESTGSRDPGILANFVPGQRSGKSRDKPNTKGKARVWPRISYYL